MAATVRGSEVTLQSGDSIDVRTVSGFATGELRIENKGNNVLTASTNATVHDVSAGDGSVIYPRGQATLPATDANGWVAAPFGVSNFRIVAA